MAGSVDGHVQLPPTKVRSSPAWRRSPFSRPEHQPLTAAQKFSVLGLGSRLPVPKVFLGLPMGTGVTYSPVAERVSLTLDTNGLEKNVGTAGSDSWTRNCWLDDGGG